MEAFHAVAGPVVRGPGSPSLMAIYLAILFVLIPFELGYLLYRARTTGSPLESVALYWEPVPRAQLVTLVLGLLVWSSFFYVLIYPPFDLFFIENLFSRSPDSFFLVEDFARYSMAALVTHVGIGVPRKRCGRPHCGGDVLPRAPAAEALSLWALGAAHQHGALLHLPFLYALAKRG